MSSKPSPSFFTIGIWYPSLHSAIGPSIPLGMVFKKIWKIHPHFQSIRILFNPIIRFLDIYLIEYRMNFFNPKFRIFDSRISNSARYLVCTPLIIEMFEHVNCLSSKNAYFVVNGFSSTPILWLKKFIICIILRSNFHLN